MQKISIVAIMLLVLCAAVFATSNSATVSVAPWYPKGNDYVFECNAFGFTPTAYDWDFGDGQKLIDVTNQNVWHTFTAPGVYDVSCTPSDGEYNWAIGSMQVTIPGETATAALNIAPWYPKGPEYVFHCDTTGLTGSIKYDWDYGDGKKLYDVTNQNTFHRYKHNGQKMVSCTATDVNDHTVIAYRQITVSGAPTCAT